MSARILVVEDDAVACDLLVEVLQRHGYEVAAAHGAEEALETARAFVPALVVTDVRMAGMDGIELLRHLRALDPAIQTIVVTAFGSLGTAVEAIQAGAFDYLSKPFAMEDVLGMVQRALDARSEASEVIVDHGESAREMLGRSPAMIDVFKAIARVGPLRVSVLIQGETGTGKELVARAIHDAGSRAAAPYVAINCPSLPEGLLESELFGHVRGAFTGATADRPGLFEAADSGTILLDEIGDMPLSVQAKLLRVLESNEIRRVGSSAVQSVDVRVLAATHRNLERCVAENTFRQDLLFRLNAVTLQVPPLRDRIEDLPLLTEHFLRRHAAASGRPTPRLAAAAITALERYPWPGNVRELSHVLERAVALASGPTIDREDLPVGVRDADRAPTDVGGPGPLHTLEDVERAHILSVLKSVDGARSRAAAILGIDRKTLYRKLLRYGLVEAEPDGEDSGGA